MTTDVFESSSQAAKRMRRYRKRRRQGTRYVRILLRVTAIDDFIRFGLLDAEQRESSEALSTVVVKLLRQAMEEIRSGPRYS